MGTPSSVSADELLDFDPEPCPFCPNGLRWFKGFDGVWRCQRCAIVYGTVNGWDQLPNEDKPEEETVYKLETEDSAEITEQLSFGS